MKRRGFFAAVAAAFFALRAKKKPKPKLEIFYIDTDSVWSNRGLDDDEVRHLFKWNMNAIYGKTAVPVEELHHLERRVGVRMALYRRI